LRARALRLWLMASIHGTRYALEARVADARAHGVEQCGA